LQMFENIPNNLFGGGDQALPVVIDQPGTDNALEYLCDPQTRQVMIDQLCN